MGQPGVDLPLLALLLRLLLLLYLLLPPIRGCHSWQLVREPADSGCSHDCQLWRGCHARTQQAAQGLHDNAVGCLCVWHCTKANFELQPRGLGAAYC